MIGSPIAFQTVGGAVVPITAVESFTTAGLAPNVHIVITTVRGTTFNLPDHPDAASALAAVTAAMQRWDGHGTPYLTLAEL